jgi:hypothetical protein
MAFIFLSLSLHISEIDGILSAADLFTQDGFACNDIYEFSFGTLPFVFLNNIITLFSLSLSLSESSLRDEQVESDQTGRTTAPARQLPPLRGRVSGTSPRSPTAAFARNRISMHSLFLS